VSAIEIFPVFKELTNGDHENVYLFLLTIPQPKFRRMALRPILEISFFIFSATAQTTLFWNLHDFLLVSSFEGSLQC